MRPRHVCSPSRARGWAFAGVLSVALLLGGCAGPNLWTDQSSVSTGRTNRGFVRSPARMPSRGKGWTIPKRWKDRKFHYGTDELVAAVQRAAKRVRASDRRAMLGVADFSRLTGGSSIWHSSHHSGRDVDLIFYQTDPRGKPLRPPDNGMIKFDDKGEPFLGPEDGESYPDADWADRRFDTRRNWELLEALLTDPSIRVQWVFVSTPLRSKMLRWAEKNKRPRWIIELARTVVHQPNGAAPHDDHFHIRVYCSRADRFHGCEDGGPVWQHEKKTFKYVGPERYDPVTWRVVLAAPRSLL